MALFEITVDVSTLATSMYLEYKNVQPDGSFSPNWTTYIGTGTSSTGQITLTPPNPTNYVITNIALNDNTVYEFRIKEICQDNTINYSPVEGYPYEIACFNSPPNTGYITYNIASFDYTLQEYPITVSWAPGGSGFDPNDYSIKEYIINITEPPSAIGPGGGSGGSSVIDHITVSAANPTIAGVGYVYNITSNDLTNPLKFNTNYNISISYNVITETGSIITVGTYCGFILFKTPNLVTYKIHGDKGWIVDWIDENNVHQRSCNTTPAPNTATQVCESPWILIHHRTNPGFITPSNPQYPICGYCATSSSIFPQQYHNSYYPAPNYYESDKVDCYPITGGAAVNPSQGPCNNCGDSGSNNIRPIWGATWEIVGTGYITINNTIPPPPCVVNNVCTGAPNW